MKMILHILLIVLAILGLTCGGSGGGGNSGPTDPGPETYSIAGKVSDVNGNGVSGVTVTFTAPGQTYTKTTGSSGTYTISFQSQGTFTVTAARGSFDITPTSHTVVVNGDITGIDFTLNSTVIRFDPVSIEIPGVGQSNTVGIMVDNVTSLFAVGFTITYDPDIIEVTNVTTSGAGFLFTDAGAPAILPFISTDNVSGSTTFLIGSTIGGSYSGASGTGLIARVTVRGKASGTSQLMFISDGSENLYLTSYKPDNVQEQHIPLSYKGLITVR